MQVRGGKAVYGASVGILMLEARFPRIPGDMGNAATWPFPVHYHVVRDASPDRVVRQQASGLLPAFLEAAKRLEADGVDGITTNCGFLALFQAELAAAVAVPVLASSLAQVGAVNGLLPEGRPAGILTISASSLTPAHLAAAGVPDFTPIGTTEGGSFTEAILGDAETLDIAAAEVEHVDAARDLATAHPDLGALVLECTNMTPYAPAIRAATGLPVFAMPGFVEWFQRALVPRRYPRP